MATPSQIPAIPRRVAHNAAVQHRLGDLLAKHLAAANLLGRAQVAQDVYRKTGKRLPIATSSKMPAAISFAEADDSATVGFSLDLPADGAANYLRALTPVTRYTFDGLTDQYRRDAFTVAGTSDVRLIAKIRDQLADVLQGGGTRADFTKAVAKLTTEAGVEQLNAFTLDTVFSTNMAKAYSLGRYEQLTDPDVQDVLPFWQYMTVGDDRVRPEHAVLDGFQARSIDPVWRKIYPPNGFNCRCIVIPLLEEEAGDQASEGGLERLPLLARAKVPTPGFGKVFA